MDMLYASVTLGHEVGTFLGLPAEASRSSVHEKLYRCERVKILENAVDDIFCWRRASRVLSRRLYAGKDFCGRLRRNGRKQLIISACTVCLLLYSCAL